MSMCTLITHKYSNLFVCRRVKAALGDMYEQELHPLIELITQEFHSKIKILMLDIMYGTHLHM